MTPAIPRSIVTSSRWNHDGTTLPAHFITRLIDTLLHRPPPLPARRDDDMRRLFRVMNRHGVTLVIDIGAGVGQFGLALRAAGYRGRILSFEPGIHAHRRLSQVAAVDPLWLVAPRAQISDTDQAGLLPLDTPASGLDEHPRHQGIDLDDLVIGDEPVDCVRLESVLEKLQHPPEQILVVVETAGDEQAVLAGAGRWANDVMAWQLELPLLPLVPGPIDPAQPAPYLQRIAQMAGLGYEAVLFGAGYFSIHVSRMVQMSGVFVRRDHLVDTRAVLAQPPAP